MEVNCFCPGCGKRFSGSYKSIGSYAKCDHLVHLDKTCSSSMCKICGIKSTILFDCDLTPESQACTNVLSIKRSPIKWAWTDWARGLGRLIQLFPTLFGLAFRLGCGLVTREYILELNKYLCKILNINVICSGSSYAKLLDSTYKRILIAPHTNYYDALVIGSLIDQSCSIGFVASDFIKTLVFGRAALKAFPHIIVGSALGSKSATNQITDFFAVYPNESKLLIFPEGMLTHESTLGKFRSGAFVSSYPIQPIIIKYSSKSRIFDLLGFDILCKDSIDVEIRVLDPIYPDPNKSNHLDNIEYIRNLIAEDGDYLLSNVVNRNNIVRYEEPN